MKDPRTPILWLILGFAVLAVVATVTDFSFLSGERRSGSFLFDGVTVNYDLPKAEVLEGARTSETRTAVVNADNGLVRSRNSRLTTASTCDVVSADVRVCLDIPTGVNGASVRVAGSADNTPSRSRTGCGWTWPTSNDVDNPVEGVPCAVEGEVLLTYELVGGAYRVSDGTKNIVVDDLNDQCFTAFAQTNSCTSNTAIAEIVVKEVVLDGVPQDVGGINGWLYALVGIVLVGALVWRFTR